MLCFVLSRALTTFTSITLHVIQFDLQMEAQTNVNHPNHSLYSSDCWNKSLYLRIEDQLSNDAFEEVYEKRMAMNESGYGGSDSKSWLLSLGQSLLLSLVLWQPLLTYFVTWIKIWMFTWNLPLLFPQKCPALLRRCCCAGSNADNLAGTIQRQSSGEHHHAPSTSEAGDHVPTRSATTDSTYSDVIAHKERPKDVLAHLANDVNVINDDDETINHLTRKDDDDDDGLMQMVCTSYRTVNSGGIEESNAQNNAEVDEVVQKVDHESKIKEQSPVSVVEV